VSSVCVVGPGYAGLPLAEAFAQHFPTIGYDIDQGKVDQLISSGSNVHATTDPASISEADFVMICVPTPVTKAKNPDLNAIRLATETIGRNLKRGAIIVLSEGAKMGARCGIRKGSSLG